MAIRVLIVEPSSGAGDWHYANMMASALADRGIDVSLATLFPYEHIAAPRRIPVFCIGPRPPFYRWPRPVSIQRAAHHVGKIKRVVSLVADLRPDVVHITRRLGLLDFAYFGLIKRFGPKIVFTVHMEPAPRSLLDRARFSKVDLVLTHATRTMHEFVRRGVAASKLRRIYHGSYLHLCQPQGLSPEEARRLLDLPSSARVVLFFGSIEERKGLDCLIDAFALIADVHPDLHLVIAGKPKVDLTQYEERIRDLAIGHRVRRDLRYIPFSEMQVHFRAASVVVLPYRNVSQSGVLQLAYAYGRPVVVTDVGGLSETVLEDGTGVVASALDSRSVANAILQLLRQPEEAERMGRRARELAETKYSWSTIAEVVEAFYRGLLDHEHLESSCRAAGRKRR